MASVGAAHRSAGGAGSDAPWRRATPHRRSNALAAAYAAAALRDLQQRAGLDVAAGFTAAALQRRARIAADRQPLLRALLEMVQQDGLLLAGDGGLRWRDGALPVASALWRSAMHALPGHVAELMLLAQAGERLAGLLRGDASRCCR